MSTLGYIYSLTVNKCILVCERLQTKFLSTNSNQTISLVMKNNFTIIDKEKKKLKRDIKKQKLFLFLTVFHLLQLNYFFLLICLVEMSVK